MGESDQVRGYEVGIIAVARSLTSRGPQGRASLPMAGGRPRAARTTSRPPPSTISHTGNQSPIGLRNRGCRNKLAPSPEADSAWKNSNQRRAGAGPPLVMLPWRRSSPDRHAASRSYWRWTTKVVNCLAFRRVEDQSHAPSCIRLRDHPHLPSRGS
jgi:hypothetical protein